MSPGIKVTFNHNLTRSSIHDRDQTMEMASLTWKPIPGHTENQRGMAVWATGAASPWRIKEQAGG
jgi:hypothetical protein